jgi:hypothetical protein
MSEEQKPANINQEQPRETWFSSWFDTYYHILYKERNYTEHSFYGQHN